MIVTDPKLIKDYSDKGWWGTTTIGDVFTQHVTSFPDRLAVVDPPNRTDFTDGEPLRLSYRELDERVNAMAVQMLAAGVVKDDIVAFQLPNVHESAVILLACAKLGAIASPILIQFDLNEIEVILQLLSPRLFITANRFKKRMLADATAPLCAKYGCEMLVAGRQAAPAAQQQDELEAYLGRTSIDANDVYTVCWTSGTEGTPKGVMRSHNHWFSSGAMVRDGTHSQPGDTVLNARPLVNMAAIGGSFMTWLLCGGTLVQHHPLDVDLVLDQIREENVNITYMPPAFIVSLLKDEQMRSKADLSSLRMMGSGSAAIPAWAVEGMEKEFGVEIVNVFGSNEGVALISNATEVPDPALRAVYFPRFGREEFQWPTLPIAKQLSTRLIDTTTGEEVLSPGHPGELHIKGSTIFSAYYGNEETTRAAFDDEGYFRSGDLFEIAGEGDLSRYYKFVGRCREVIIRGGFNIAPAELDNLLSKHPDIEEVACFGYPDQRLGELVAVAAVPRIGVEISLSDIVSYLKEQRIAVFKLPQKLMIVDQLPRNALLKVLRRKLVEQAVAKGL